MMPPTQLMNKFSPTPNDLTLEELHLVVWEGEFLTDHLSVLWIVVMLVMLSCSKPNWIKGMQYILLLLMDHYQWWILVNYLWKKVVERRALWPIVVQSMRLCCPLSPKCPMPSMPVKAPYSGRLYTSEWWQSTTCPAMFGCLVHCVVIFWTFAVHLSWQFTTCLFRLFQEMSNCLWERWCWCGRLSWCTQQSATDWWEEVPNKEVVELGFWIETNISLDTIYLI